MNCNKGLKFILYFDIKKDALSNFLGNQGEDGDNNSESASGAIDDTSGMVETKAGSSSNSGDSFGRQQNAKPR